MTEHEYQLLQKALRKKLHKCVRPGDGGCNGGIRCAMSVVQEIYEELNAGASGGAEE